MTNLPQFLSKCDEWDRAFPEDWKMAYWRRHVDKKENAYECPVCHKVFSNSSGYSQLHCDHVKPYSQFIKGVDFTGPTTWDNLQLLCGECNRKKYNNPV